MDTIMQNYANRYQQLFLKRGPWTITAMYGDVRRLRAIWQNSRYRVAITHGRRFLSLLVEITPGCETWELTVNVIPGRWGIAIQGPLPQWSRVMVA